MSRVPWHSLRASATCWRCGAISVPARPPLRAPSCRHAPAAFLDGQYTIWGQVTSGMEAVDKIKRGAGQSGAVTAPDKIISLRLASEAPH